MHTREPKVLKHNIELAQCIVFLIGIATLIKGKQVYFLGKSLMNQM